MRRPLEVKIGEPVVDKVHRQSVRRQNAVLKSQIRCIGNGGVNAVSPQAVAREQELRIKILPLWIVIDDGNTAQSSVPAFGAPLVGEHRRRRSLETAAGVARQAPVDSGATGALRIERQGIQIGATRIGVDLDE